MDYLGTRRRGGGGKKQRSKGTHVSFDPPTVDWQKVQSIIVTLCVLFLVAAFLLFAFFLYSDSPTMHKFTIYGDDVSRVARVARNLTVFMQRSAPPINYTEAVRSMWPQSDEEARNVTMRGKRAVSDLAYLVNDLKETGIVKTIAELSHTISEILLRPNFGNILDSLEAGVPMIFDTLKKDEAKEFLHVFQAILEKIGELLTEERVDKVINVLDDADVKNLLSHTSSFIQESTKIAKSINKVLDKVSYVVEHEDEYITPVFHNLRHVFSFIEQRINEKMLDDTIHKIQSVDWTGVWKEVKSYYVILEGIRDHSNDTSIVNVAKNLTSEITSLIKQIEDSGLIQSSASGISKMESALSKEEIHEGYVQLVASMKKTNDILQDLGQHHVMADFVSLVERFERMEKIVETIFTPLERGMDLYNHEQQREEEGEGGAKGNIQATTKLIGSIEQRQNKKKKKNNNK